MDIGHFDERLWEERLADSLFALADEQKPFLHQHWQSHGFPAKVSFNGRDETPFPADDHFIVYEDATHSFRFGNAEYFAPLKAALDPVRGVLRDHPVVARALGNRISVSEVQVGILNAASLTSLSALIVGHAQTVAGREEAVPEGDEGLDQGDDPEPSAWRFDFD